MSCCPTASFFGFGSARRSSNVSGTVNCGAMTCTYRPSTTAKVVRRISCRRTISLMLRSRTATSTADVSRSA